MKKTVYEDYKYSMQDTGKVYVGSKYTLDEILESEDMPFKFRLIVERYILPEADLQDTLETHLYYLEPKSFIVKIYKQLKAKVKVNVIEEKRSIFGSKKQYVTKLVTVEELTAMSREEKESKGLVVQELIMSKLALMAF
jgi:hypothetical protein